MRGVNERSIGYCVCFLEHTLLKNHLTGQCLTTDYDLCTKGEAGIKVRGTMPKSDTRIPPVESGPGKARPFIWLSTSMTR